MTIKQEIQALLQMAQHARQFDSKGAEVETYLLALAWKAYLADQAIISKNVANESLDSLNENLHNTVLNLFKDLSSDLTEDHAKVIGVLVNKVPWVEPLSNEIIDEISNPLIEYIKLDSKRIIRKVLTYIILPIALSSLVLTIIDRINNPRVWRAEYFTNIDLQGKPFGVYYEKMPSHKWDHTPPKPGMSSDYYSVRWRSKMILDKDEELVFNILTDDGARLYVNNKLILDKWFPQAPTAHTVTETFPAGEHEVALEYFEKRHGAEVDLKVSSKSGMTPTFISAK